MATASPLNTLLSRMASIEHQDIDRDLMACLFGGPGAGKTTTALALAQRLKGDGKILLLDSAEGYVSMEAMPFLMEDVQVVPNVTSKELAAVTEAFSGKRAKQFEDFTVCIVDEASSIAQEVLETVVRDRANASIGDILPEIEGKDYGPMTQIVGAMVRRLQKVEGLHVIIVAHDREKEDKRRGLTIHPQFPPLLLKELQKIMHVTAYQVARVNGQGKYTFEIQARPTVTVQCKSRIPNTPVLQSPEAFVDMVAEWVGSDSMVEDVNAPEGNEDIPEGDLPVDGDLEPEPGLYPEPNEYEDAPAYVGEPS